MIIIVLATNYHELSRKINTNMKIHTNKNSIVYKDLSYQIIGLAMEAHGKLGFGFLEKVYENAMMVLF